jgi:hypothetical protein
MLSIAERLRLLVALVAVAMSSAAGTAAEPSAPSPIAPKSGEVKLLDGRGLPRLYTWLKDSAYRDPRGVFHMEQGVLHISGEGLGYIATREAYRDYRLVIEFRWGERLWGSRKERGRARDSGIFLHAIGPDGNFVDAQYHADYPIAADGRPSAGEYVTCVEAQIMEGAVGDIILIQGKERGGRAIPVELTAELAGGGFWKKGSPKRTFSTNACVQWFGHDPLWKDATGIRGKNDVESPVGQWTRIEVECRGRDLRVHVNGTLVNEATKIHPSSGKVCIQCELAELYVRRWELHPLDLPK